MEDCDQERDLEVSDEFSYECHEDDSGYSGTSTSVFVTKARELEIH